MATSDLLPDELKFNDGAAWVAVQPATGTADIELANSGSTAVKILNVAVPTNPTDAANMAYVDGQTGGIYLAGNVRAATSAATGSIPATGDTIDGVTLGGGNPFLLKDHTNLDLNGIYTAGTPSARSATTMPTGSEAHGTYVTVAEGLNNGGSGWVCTAPSGAIVDDSTPMPFGEFVEPVTLDGITLQRTALGIVEVKDGGINNAKLVNDSLTVTAGTGLSGGGSVALGASTSLNVGTSILRTTTAGTGPFQVLFLNQASPAAAASKATMTFNTNTDTLAIPAGFITAGTLTSTSDARLKLDVRPVETGLELVKALRPVIFRWRDGGDDRDHAGFLAQEIQPLLPGAVQEAHDGRLSVNHNEIISMLVEAVQSLSARVEALESLSQ